MLTRIAVADLGSHSFYLLMVIKDDTGQWGIAHDLRAVVRLRSGLAEDGSLGALTIDNALGCLSRFGDALKQFAPQLVRVVGTEIFRQAYNPGLFLAQAELCLGYPLEIITGEQEARWMYQALLIKSKLVTNQHALAIDVGGGSLELALGQGLDPATLFSIPLGCLLLQAQFYKDNRLTADLFKQLIFYCKSAISPVCTVLKKIGWQYVMAGSGSAQVLLDVVKAKDPDAHHQITLAQLKQMASIILASKHINLLAIPGLQEDHKMIFPAIVGSFIAMMEMLEISEIDIYPVALRHGLLFSLLITQEEASQLAAVFA